MRSSHPKVLHAVGRRPMLLHVMDCVVALNMARTVVVVSATGRQVAEAAQRRLDSARIVVQKEQRGTGHAVREAREALEGLDGDVFVLYGDTPFVRRETLASMLAQRRQGADIVVLGFEASDPGPYGRLVIGDDGELDRIVEARDATLEERAITLCNSGVMCVDRAQLFQWLSWISNDNAAGEFYLTDIVAAARVEGARCAVVKTVEAEVLGVNSRAELARAEATFQGQARVRAMAGGATLIAPASVFFSYDTQLGPDVVVEPNVVFGPGVVVADGVTIKSFSHLEGCRVASGATIGPFARLRPGASIGPNVRIGNYVEVKNADVASGAKINHLSYIGDAKIGCDANIGAGVITCNYNGFAKHPTLIGDEVFVGSNTALVAPVSIGKGALIGAGSTITEDVPADALAIARERQSVKPAPAASRLRTLAANRAAKK